MYIHKAISLLQQVQHRKKKKKKILYKHTLDFAGPTKNSKTTSVENQSTPLHQIEEHQGILQNQRALYLVSVQEQGLFPMLSQNIELLVHEVSFPQAFCQHVVSRSMENKYQKAPST